MTNLLKNNLGGQMMYDYIWTTFDPSAVVPLTYEGVIAGSEFLTYAATKLYLALELEADYGTASAGIFALAEYNNLNALKRNLTNDPIAWTGAALNYMGNTIIEYNTWFSRVGSALAVYIKFIGYKFTY